VLGKRNSTERGDYWFFISPVITRHGYVDYVLVSEDGRRRHKYAHRLVAECFIPNPDNCPEVDHRDMNKLHNFRYNLDWVTHKENQKRARDNGAWSRKLTEDDEVEVCEKYKAGAPQKDLAILKNVSVSTISLVIRYAGLTRERWKKRIPQDVVDSIRMASTFGASSVDLAKKHGVNYQTVVALVKNRRRKCPEYQKQLDLRA